MVAATRTKQNRTQDPGSSSRHAGAGNRGDRHSSPSELPILSKEPAQVSTAPESESPEDRQAPALAPALKVGDRVRIVKAPRSVGKLATITETNPKLCYGKELLILPDGDTMVMAIIASGVEFVERPETEPIGEGDSGETAIAPTSALDSLITEISALYGQIEEAEEVRENAEFSALTFALEMGAKLLIAKDKAGHGNWEKTRNQIISPRSGKAIPSTTATLYQRMAERKFELEQAEICTIRAAAKFLKSDRQLPAKSATVAEIPPSPPSPPSPLSPPSPSPNTQHPTPNTPSPKLPPDFATQTDEEVGLVAHLPPICKPSITPEEFNREMQANSNQFSGCLSCVHHRLTGQGDRYWCEQGEFDDTLLLKQNWMEMNEGCKSFTQPVPGLKPTYPVPKGVLRLEDVEGGKELHGFILSEERLYKLAALARSLNGSMAAALFSLIDQLPELEDGSN